MHGSCGHPGETWVYKYYDRCGTLLYVGASNFPMNRRREILKYSWGNKIVSVTMRLYPTRRGALIAEKRAIHNEKPKFNIIHATIKNQHSISSTPRMEIPLTVEKPISTRLVSVMVGRKKRTAEATILQNGWAKIQLPHPYGYVIFKRWKAA